MTIPKEVTDFLDSFIGRSPRTRENYENFATIFWEQVKKPVAEVTPDDMLNFLTSGMKNLGWKASTAKQYAKLALKLFNNLRDEAFMKQLKKKLQLLPRVQDRAALYEGNYVPTDRINDFIKSAPNEEWAVFYTMILKWGLRLMEALTITPSTINFKIGRVVVGGKGFGGMGKIRQVMVERSTIHRVLKFAGCTQEQMSGLKPIRDRNPIIKTIKPRTAELQWKRTAKKIGLENWSKLTPHDGRHSYAIDFLTKRKKEGMAALVLLKNQLGHSSLNTTMIYLDIAGAEAQDIFDAGVINSGEGK